MEEGSSAEGRSTRWKLPPENVVKINFDAALNANNETVGLRIPARNAKERFIGAWGEGG